MKIDRLMGIVMILLRQDKITAPELAARFEVSRRTSKLCLMGAKSTGLLRSTARTAIVRSRESCCWSGILPATPICWNGC